MLPLVMILALMGPVDRMDTMPGEALFLATNRHHEAVGTDSRMRTPGKPVTNTQRLFVLTSPNVEASMDRAVKVRVMFNQARQFVVGHGIAEGQHQQDGPCQGSDHPQGAESAQSGKCLAKDDPRDLHPDQGSHRSAGGGLPGEVKDVGGRARSRESDDHEEADHEERLAASGTPEHRQAPHALQSPEELGPRAGCLFLRSGVPA